MDFDDIFDLDGDGKLNSIERAIQYDILFRDGPSDEDDGFHSYSDDDAETDDAYPDGEYDEDYSDDEFEDEEEEEDSFEWDPDEPLSESAGKNANRKSYREQFGRIIDMISETMTEADDLLFDLETDPSGTEEMDEMAEALENAKIDLEMMLTDLEGVLG